MKRPVARKSRKREDSKVADLEKRLAEAQKREAEALKREAEALEQRTATGEILRVISSSLTDLQPVLDALVRSAARFCAANDALIHRLEGNGLAAVAHHGPILTPHGFVTPVAGTATGRSVLERRAVHVADTQAETEMFPEGSAIARELGFHTMLSVPLLREGVPLGAIVLRRTEVKPFSEKQIALLETFADQAVIAIENVRLFNETKEALEQQTATSEILRVISSSPTDAQPVFDTIVRSSDRLLGGLAGSLALRVGDAVHLVALTPTNPEGDAVLRRLYPMPIGEDGGHAEVVRLCRPSMITDTEAELTGRTREFARIRGFRSRLSVPLIRDGIAIGSLGVTRAAPGAFTDREIALLQTFADQAVIAIENVRLFSELEGRNRDLTATSEILQVISRSATDAQPVFDTIAERAMRLCDAAVGFVGMFDGALIHVRALANISPEGVDAIHQAFPAPPSRGSAGGRVILTGDVVQIPDALEDPEYQLTGAARVVRFRGILGVPMLHQGRAVGVISVGRPEPGMFSEEQVQVLKTFADQAVIAIENVRLFTELEARNLDLTEALDRQTATAEVLRVISRSQMDIQPVFAAILDSAIRLCGADMGGICRVEGERIFLVEFSPNTPKNLAVLRDSYPRPVDTTSLTGRAVVEARVVHVPDVDAPTAPPVLAPVVRGIGFRSHLSVPMLRGGHPIGVLALQRREPGPFSDAQIALVQTFADQAVIAIENVRLLSELQARTADLTRSVSELTALGEVGRALSSTLNLEAVLQTIVTRANQLAGTAGCVIWEYDKPREEFRLRVSHYADDSDAATLPARGGVTTIPRGQGLTTQVMEERRPVQIPDITVEGVYESLVRKSLIDAGHRALLGVPLLSEDEIIGVLAVTRKTLGLFEPETVRLLSTFATQSALAIQNARLFLEIEDKSRQLEAASQHKSEFLANMSHELRTPLNAIIGFSEVLNERMFGELNEKQSEYLKDIYASGQHLLSLINDILDLSKIEAGRMELELTDFDVPSAIENALTLVRERASRRGITLGQEISNQVATIRGDERKVKQVLLNLLSNALKFTPEGGRVDVRASLHDGLVDISVTDSGIGIAPEDQEKVFEEFRQVGAADKKVEGTGLGLALSRKFIELHGGRIWVQSQLNVGSTFTFTIPVRRGE